MTTRKTLIYALTFSGMLGISGTAVSQPQLGDQDDDVRAPSAEMLDAERESSVGSGPESHERMAHTGRPDVRSGESIEDAMEDADDEDAKPDR